MCVCVFRQSANISLLFFITTPRRPVEWTVKRRKFFLLLVVVVVVVYLAHFCSSQAKLSGALKKQTEELFQLRLPILTK